MAVMKIARTTAPADGGAQLLETLGVGMPFSEEVVSDGKTTKPLTRAEWPYLLAAFALIVVGAVIGIGLDDGKREYAPPDGVTIFALFYIVAQAIERILEPLSHFFGATTASGDTKPADAPKKLITKSMAVKKRDAAIALLDPKEAAKQSAWWQEILDQIRRNTTTLWAVASMLGIILSGWLGLLLLHAVKAPHAPRGLDIVITGIILGAGTKPLHDLIGNIQAGKEQKQNPKEVTGSSSS